MYLNILHIFWKAPWEIYIYKYFANNLYNKVETGIRLKQEGVEQGEGGGVEQGGLLRG